MNYEEELIREQLLNLNFEEFTTKKLNYIGKSSKIAEKARQKGNKLYTGKDHGGEIHKQIFNYYSMSVAYAPEASKELALAYGNRSALLLHFKKYAESLQDLNRALNITTSDSLKVKLYCRKVECLTKMGFFGNEIAFKEAVKYFNRIGNDEKKDLDTKINKAKFFLEYKKQKSMVKKDEKKSMLFKNMLHEEQNIFDSVDIKYSKKYGRHLVATKEFKPGDILYVEKPYVVCSNIKVPYIYCCNCLVVAWTGIPCKYCNWCIFCSVECRQKAWKSYHNIECSIIPCIKKLQKNFVYSFRLSLRIIIMVIQQFGSINKFKSEVEQMDESTGTDIKNFLKDENFFNKFKSVYTLSHDVTKEQFKINVHYVAIILTCIAKNTSFFNCNVKNKKPNQKYSNLVQNKNTLFLGALLLKLINISCVNRHRILNSLQACKSSIEPFKCMVNECCSKGMCLAPVSSLINNSCIPNVKRCFTEDQRIIIYAVEPIEKNSQIFDSYLCNFYDIQCAYRSPILKQHFYVTCNCVACERNWPPLFNKTQVEKKFIDTQRSFLETKFIEEHKEMLSSVHDQNMKYNLETIQNLMKGIEKASKILPQPCSIRCILTFSLQKVVEKMFGYSIQIFNSCQNSA